MYLLLWMSLWLISIINQSIYELWFEKRPKGDGSPIILATFLVARAIYPTNQLKVEEV